MRRQLRFVTLPARQLLHFFVPAPRRVLVFETGPGRQLLHFRTKGSDRQKLLFTTGNGRRKVFFRTGQLERNLLTAELTADKKALRVKLSVRFQDGPYTLLARSENGERLEVQPLEGRFTQYTFQFPVCGDAVWHLSAAKSAPGAPVVAAAVVLVNDRCLRHLAKLGKRFNCRSKREFHEYYRRCGEAIVLYQASEFAACQTMLNLLRDLTC